MDIHIFTHDSLYLQHTVHPKISTEQRFYGNPFLPHVG